MTDDRHENEGLDLQGLVLPDQGIVELADKLTGYMTEIQLGGLPDVIGQVLDDFLEQCGGMPEDLTHPDAFNQITRNQLAVTLAYQLGRLEGTVSPGSSHVGATNYPKVGLASDRGITRYIRQRLGASQGIGLPTIAPLGIHGPGRGGLLGKRGR